MSERAGLEVERNEAIALVALNRPERKNALSIEMRDVITETLAELCDDPDVKVIVITGRGDTFSSGFDLKEFGTALQDDEFAERLWDSSDRFHRAVLECPAPTIAAVNGPAIGGGFDLAVMCDLRVASTTAWFEHPELTFGDVVYAPLHDIVGGAFARELVLTGRRVDAAEALDRGLVAAMVEPESVLSRARELARSIAAAPRHYSRRTKAKIIRRAGIQPRSTLDL